MKEEDIDKLFYKSSNSSLQTLIKALDDPDLRSEAISAILTHKRASEAVPKLLSMLESDNKSTKLDVMEALERLSDPHAVEPLLETLGNSDEEIRMGAAWALVRNCDRDTLAPMLERLRNASDETKETVWYALGDAGWADELRHLSHLLNEDNWTVKPEDRRVMLEPPTTPVRKLPQKEIDKIMADIEELGSADIETAERAKSRLARRRGQVVELLAEATASPNIVVRHLALHTLERIGDPRTFPIFVEMAHERMPDMRWCALEALGKVGKERAIPVLIDVLKNADESSTEHEGAFRGILAIGEPAIPAVMELMKSGDRSRVPYLLAQIGGEAAVEPLAELLDDPDPDVRITGIESLASLAENHPETLGSRCLALIERALKDPEEEVRNDATYSCKDIRGILDRLKHEPT